MIDLKTLTLEQLKLVANNQRIYSCIVKQELVNEINKRNRQNTKQ